MGLGDLVQIIDNQSYLDQQVLNVYYYQCMAVGTDPDLSLEALATWFYADLIADVTAIQMDGLLHNTLDLRNLENGVDFYTGTTVVPGQISSAGAQELASWMSAGFILRRSTLATRNGYKRFAGLSETDVAGNLWITSTARLDTIATALAIPVTTTNNDEFIPVIVKRPIPEPNTVDPTTNPIVSASFRGLGTQNTRKPGRGI